MLTIFIRAIVLYLLLMLAMRGMGKRQMGQFQPYEFVLVLLIANLVTTPISDAETPLLHGMLPIAALFLMDGLIKVICMHSDKLRALISGKPSVIISKGIIQQDELERLCLTLSDVLEGLRVAGYIDLTQVGTAVMEANGTISAFPDAHNRPPTTVELGIDPGYEGLPMVLVMDGRIQESNMVIVGKDEAWLQGILTNHAMALENVFYCSVNTQGIMHIQDRSGQIHDFRALESGGVAW